MNPYVVETLRLIQTFDFNLLTKGFYKTLLTSIIKTMTSLY